MISIFQVLQYRTARTQITFLPLSLLKVALLQVNICRKVFSDMLFKSTGCFVQSPPFALPHFNNLQTFFLYIVSSQCIEVSLLATTLNTFFSEKWTHLLTRAEVVKATHGFKHSVAMRTKPIITEVVNFLLSACCKKLSISRFGLVRWK